MPEQARGRGFGYYNFIVGGSALPASLLTGWLWKQFGPAVALSIGAGLAGVAAVLLVRWSRPRLQQSTETAAR